MPSHVFWAHSPRLGHSGNKISRLLFPVFSVIFRVINHTTCTYNTVKELWRQSRAPGQRKRSRKSCKRPLETYPKTPGWLTTWYRQVGVRAGHFLAGLGAMPGGCHMATILYHPPRFSSVLFSDLLPLLPVQFVSAFTILLCSRVLRHPC